MLNHLSLATFSHLAIVGKEPLVNDESIQRCEELILQFVAKKKSVSLITNGHNLNALKSPVLRQISWIDISLDGGPRTYNAFRGASYPKLIQAASNATNSGCKQLNALHTINSRNIQFIDDMMLTDDHGPFNRIVFSPYVETKHHGINSVGPVSLSELTTALSSSPSFINSPKSVLLLTAQAYPQLDTNTIRRHLSQTGLLAKTHYLERDPLELGLVRLTYDGRVLTPLDSLHPLYYRDRSVPFTPSSSIERIYNDFRSSFKS